MPADPLPEGIFSILDTDLYKLTMQSAVLKYFPDAEVTYAFTNRTPEMKLNRAAFKWLEQQVARLANITISNDELEYLKKHCNYLSAPYLHFIENFRFQPDKHVKLTFLADSNIGGGDEPGALHIHTHGKWIDTILYEIPLLALTSEAYFKFIDRDWTYDDQTEKAYQKGLKLLEGGCVVSEFGSRRRRDYKTQDIVLKGLMQAQREADEKGWKGKITGTSNVHFAMKYDIMPIGTVAHEWFMGVAAITENYKTATETALDYWVATFGRGVLAIALTDTFGTPTFLEAFKKNAPIHTTPGAGLASTTASASTIPGERNEGTMSSTDPPVQSVKSLENGDPHSKEASYAQIFTGTRQDSGDPLEFVKTMRRFYDDQKITDKKTIVFSDSLNVERCIEYKKAAESAGFSASFGVGTNFTNDFVHKSDGRKSVPLNIVIKLSSANGKHAVKISDNIGKNTGDKATVDEVKHILGYTEKGWIGGDEKKRWGVEGENSLK